MVTPRLIGTVPVKNGRVARSYSYNSFKPGIGVREALITLERWGLDEILVLDISRANEISNYLLSQIKAAAVQTPIVFGGGIRGLGDLDSLLVSGVDRFLLESCVYKENRLLEEMKAHVGQQALLASVPVVPADDDFYFSPANEVEPLEDISSYLRKIVSWDLVSEFIVIDKSHEGMAESFDLSVVEKIKDISELQGSVVWFGGIGPSQAKTLGGVSLTAGVALANPLFQTELGHLKFRENCLLNA